MFMRIWDIHVHFPRGGGPVGYRMGKDVMTQEFEASIPLDEQMGYDERLRLLYVACTRACDHLVVSLHRADRANPTAPRNHTNAEVLVAGMGDRVADLVDLGGPAEPLPADGEDEMRMLAEATEAAEALGADRNEPLGMPQVQTQVHGAGDLVGDTPSAN